MSSIINVLHASEWRKIFSLQSVLPSFLCELLKIYIRCDRTETEYVSQMLTKIKRFSQHHSCHVWFVAHPKQLQHWDGGAPNLYDISGSAHFINKCDNGIIVHRNRDEKAGPLDLVQVGTNPFIFICNVLFEKWPSYCVKFLTFLYVSDWCEESTKQGCRTNWWCVFVLWQVH